jgi:predicted short-subunit dehydrogenase-like oxidoreductase (DUF2520 family)
MSDKVTNLKPTVNIIGPGRLGMALGIALSLRGYTIRSLIGRRSPSIRKAAAMLDVSVDLLVTKDIGNLLPADLLIISTPDDQIASVVKAISTLIVEGRNKPFAFHTSGALSSEVLSPLFRKGWQTGSLHPLVSVSDPIEGAASFKGAFWCVEGEPKAVRMGKSIIRDLEGHSFSVPSSSKPLYHAAAVMTSGNVVALFDVAIEMLSRCGLKRNEAKRVLLPLLESTAQNVINRDPAKALTGTFSRGDIATVERHLAALSGKELLEARTLYRLLGMRSLALAEANGLDRTVVRRIAKKLKD